MVPELQLYLPLAQGINLLGEKTSKIIWRGRSLFLCAGCEDVLPHFSVSIISGTDSESQIAAKPIGAPCVAMAFEADENTCEWAMARGAELLLPTHELVGRIGDKTLLPEILERARLPVIPHLICEMKSYIAAEPVWDELGSEPLVVQRSANNLTGKGTRLATDKHELSNIFAEWGHERLKVSRYIDGMPLTISGCVGPNHTIISAISRQLVGIPRLTCFWGAHCGNQLAGRSTLGDEIVAQCSDACRKVGDQLRGLGFRGAFGLDLLQTLEGQVLVLEINPRFQSVSSLVNIAEIEAGMLPIPGVHLLSFLMDELPLAVFDSTPETPHLSQLVLYARREGTLSSAPDSGCYRLEKDEMIRVCGLRNARYISDEDIFVWVFARPGDNVNVDTRLCVLQARSYLADTVNQSALTSTALGWLDVLESRFKYQ